MLLDFLPLGRHDLSLDAVRLEILKLCEQLPLGILSSKEVEAIKDLVRLKKYKTL